MLLNSEIEKGTLILTLNRPERGNSFNPPLLVELYTAISDAQKNNKVKVIILTGSGEKDFCTGIDVNSVMKFPTDAKLNLANTAGDIATIIYHGKPTIVAINGRAMGMGVVYAVAADYRYIVQNTTCQMPEVNFGIFPGASCIALMSRVCGVSWTKKILMNGLPIPETDAIKANIADEIVDRPKLLINSKEMAKILSSKNPINLKSIKYATNSMPDLNYMEGIRIETDLANWYEWSNPDIQVNEILNKYKIKYELTGDPNKLMQDYEKYKE
jgi:enoyl-CoA hydratase/carnithine racemase